MAPILGLAVVMTAFTNTDLISSLQFVSQMGGVVLEALGQIFASWGDLAAQNPAALGVLLLMTGAVMVWSGVYNRMVNQPVAITH